MNELREPVPEMVQAEEDHSIFTQNRQDVYQYQYPEDEEPQIEDCITDVEVLDEEIAPEVLYPFSQGAPFYGMQEVTEDDPDFLIKLMTLEPPPKYVPSFLRNSFATSSSENHEEAKNEDSAESVCSVKMIEC